MPIRISLKFLHCDLGTFTRSYVSKYFHEFLLVVGILHVNLSCLAIIIKYCDRRVTQATAAFVISIDFMEIGSAPQLIILIDIFNGQACININCT